MSASECCQVRIRVYRPVLITNSTQIGVGVCTALVGAAMHCILLSRLYIMERLKWQQSQANAADRGDRVQFMYTRVYSITYRGSISVHFLRVQLFLVRVNHACTTNRTLAAHDFIHEGSQAAAVHSSLLLGGGGGGRLVVVRREREEPAAVVRAAVQRVEEGRVATNPRQLLQRVIGRHDQPLRVGADAAPLHFRDEGVAIRPHLNLLLQFLEPPHARVVQDHHGLSALHAHHLLEGLI